MGPQGCGKSSLINLATGQTDCMTSTNSKLCTTTVRSCKYSKRIKGDEFRFTDTPGFGNEVLDDKRILEMLIQYLAPDPHGDRNDSAKPPLRVTGMLYVHPEDEPLKNRTSQKTMRMLVEILGEHFLDRVTVLVQFRSRTQGVTSNFMPPENSPLYPLYSSTTRPWTMTYPQDSQSVVRILGHYAELHPRLIGLAALNNFVQGNGGNWPYHDIPRHPSELLPEGIGPSVIACPPDTQSHSHEQENKFEGLGNSLSQEEMNGLRTIHDVELVDTGKDKSYEKIAHEIELNYQSLCEMIQTQGEKISILKSSRDSELKEFEDMKNKEFSRLNWERDSEIKVLRDKLQARHKEMLELKKSKDEELGKLVRKKDSEIKGLQDLLARKDDEITGLQSSHSAGLQDMQKFALQIEISCKSLCQTIQHQEGKNSKLETNKYPGLEDLGAQLKPHQFGDLSELNSERDSEVEGLQHKIEAKDEELKNVKVDYERRIQEYINFVQARESEIIELKTQINNTVAKGEPQEDDISRLNEELHRIKAEYASLRCHMQLQQNTEQVDIITALDNINRLIEEFGLSLSEHIGSYMEINFPQKTFQPQALLSLFGPVGNGLASKVKGDACLLFQYAIRATICDQLCTHLFKPFHPCIGENEELNGFIMRLYDQLTHQEPQIVTGRWRKDAFNSISRDSSLGCQDKPDNKRMHQIITEALSRLLGRIVVMQPQELLKGHVQALIKIISEAEELNQLLKGDVSSLGDFQPIVFPFGEAFQPKYMSNTIPKPKKEKHPQTILATIGLGILYTPFWGVIEQ
ncbi:hypothetical protein OPQ81_011597 [Rhizoctonia solani]|nr:hypothetical protein OPQ81_011597 [Rhizoctonia solani]